MKKGIILIHEYWGINGQMKKVAKRLEDQGFEVLLADLYKGKLATSPDEGRVMKEAVVDSEAMIVLEGAVSELEKRGIKREHVAVWGFCMGGSFSFLYAVTGAKIGACIIYYGSRISTDRNLISKINVPVMGVFGGSDKAIPRELVKSFGDALEAEKKANEIDIYNDAGHAFFNEERESYNEKAAKDAWEKTLTFLSKHI